MKLALAGKGGSGKTALAALFARVFSEQGHMVLAVDLDVNPGLAVSLGLPLDGRFPLEGAVEERSGAPYGWALSGHLTPAEAARRCGIPVSPRIVYLGIGDIAHAKHPMRRYITAARQVSDGFDEPGWAVVVDLGSGPTPIFEGDAGAAELVLVLAEPSVASMLGAERLLSILAQDGTPAQLVTNETRPSACPDGISGAPPSPWAVPFDPDLIRLERTGSLVGLPVHSRALAAVRAMAARIDAGADPNGEIAHAVAPGGTQP